MSHFKFYSAQHLVRHLKEYLIYRLNSIDKIILVLISMNNKKSAEALFLLHRFYLILACDFKYSL